MNDTRLIYVYDSNGTLVNGKPFVGFESAFSFLGFVKSQEYESIRQCRPNGDMRFRYYFRTRPTTVFKSKVKFYSLKLKG